MRTTIKKIFCFLLITAILLTAFSFMPAKQAAAEALDFTDIQTKLNTWQYYFCRTFMSLALKDYYDTGILPSITVGQALYEGGCAGHPISVIGKNHYGIKACLFVDGFAHLERAAVHAGVEVLAICADAHVLGLKTVAAAHG